jgi:hypothetical protein
VGNENRTAIATENTFNVGSAKIERTEGWEARDKAKPNTADYTRAPGPPPIPRWKAADPGQSAVVVRGVDRTSI